MFQQGSKDSFVKFRETLHGHFEFKRSYVRSDSQKRLHIFLFMIVKCALNCVKIVNWPRKTFSMRITMAHERKLTLFLLPITILILTTIKATFRYFFYLHIH